MATDDQFNTASDHVIGIQCIDNETDRKGQTRRAFISGLSGVLASAIFLPRWVWAQMQNQASNAVAAVREIYEKTRNIPQQLSMKEIAAKLTKEYGIKVQVSAIKWKGGKPIPCLKCPDGEYIADANGNGIIDTSDYDFANAVNELRKKIGVTKAPSDGREQIDITALKKITPTLDQQRTYPLAQITELFAQARFAATKAGGQHQARVKNSLEKFLSIQRDERKLRDELDALSFVAKSEAEIRKAADEQARLLDRMQKLRDDQVLPVLEELAYFIRNGSWNQ